MKKNLKNRNKLLLLFGLGDDELLSRPKLRTASRQNVLENLFRICYKEEVRRTGNFSKSISLFCRFPVLPVCFLTAFLLLVQ